MLRQVWTYNSGVTTSRMKSWYMSTLIEITGSNRKDPTLALLPMRLEEKKSATPVRRRLGLEVGSITLVFRHLIEYLGVFSIGVVGHKPFFQYITFHAYISITNWKRATEIQTDDDGRNQFILWPDGWQVKTGKRGMLDGEIRWFGCITVMQPNCHWELNSETCWCVLVNNTLLSTFELCKSL